MSSNQDGDANSSSSNDITPAQSTAAISASQSNGQDDGLVCRWKECTDRFTTPELLYDHICERHVGRKSTNNLNLTCQWDSCRTSTVKRDHITSHVRVHVPLKPYKCDLCGRSFKRPQDLKKHTKTHHAIDPAMDLPSPQDPSGRTHTGKAAPSYYGHNDQILLTTGTPATAFAQPLPQNWQAGYFSQQQSYTNSVYFQQTNQQTDYVGHQQATGPYDAHPRHSLEDLSHFFGQAGPSVASSTPFPASR